MLDSAQTLYTAVIQTAGMGDKSLLFSLAKDIFKEHKEAVKAAGKPSKTDLTRGRKPLSDEATDAEIKARSKLLFVDRLNDGSLTAAEIAQFKDVFNLSGKDESLAVIVTDYADVVTECPACGANVYSPLIEPIDSTEDKG